MAKDGFLIQLDKDMSSIKTQMELKGVPVLDVLHLNAPNRFTKLNYIKQQLQVGYLFDSDK